MTYLQAHNRPYGQLKRIIYLFIFLIVISIFTIRIFIPNFFSNIFTTIARPFWRLEFSVQQGSLKSPSSLLAENADLRRRFDEFQIRLDAIKAIEIENYDLKILLGREKDLENTSSSTVESNITTNSQKKILAAVLINPPLNNINELTIDIGADYSVSTSSLVYASGNIIIGRVASVLENTAKVVLFSSPGEKHRVFIGPANTLAIATGRGGGQYEAQLAQGSGIVSGDFVISPSLSDKPFGIVREVLIDPNQLFETVLFAPLININQIRWVLVQI